MMASTKIELKLRLSWRGRLAMAGCRLVQLAACCGMVRLAEAIAKRCFTTLMSPGVWVVCRS